MSKEIERKFLIKDTPEEIKNEMMMCYSAYIEQNYISIGENELRIRTKIDGIDKPKHYLTYKSGRGLIRSEQEIEIDMNTCQKIIKHIKQKPIRKDRFVLDYNGYKVELDKYYDLDLLIAEVEFQSEEKARNFKIPYWFGEEVTDINEYKNQNLWVKLNEGNVNI